MKKTLFFFWALLALAAVPDLFARDYIEGRVIDEDGGGIELVTVKSTDFVRPVQTDHEGRFEAEITKSGEISMTFSHAGYIPRSVKVRPGKGPIEVTLIEQAYPMEGITVTAGRAVVGRSPISFETIDKEEIERDFDIGEVPEFLETTPNLYAYSDAGGGLGYSYLKIRGFDARRVPVYINGIPLNDPEDHTLYFVDLPDLTNSADNIQVQRGVGNSLYGDPSFGGSINILTSPLSRTREFTGEFGYGGFLQGSETVGIMRKSSVSYSTGLLGNGWSLSGRYLEQFSDGYRKNAWYDGYAYYFSLARIDPSMITTLNIYGGPMRLHAAWDGIDRATAHIDRRTNWYTYADETDNFDQPHYELHNVYNITENMTAYNSIYLIRGEGYYEQFRNDTLLYYNLSDDSGVTSDLVRRKWVDKYQLGANSEIVYEGKRQASSAGLSYYFFESEHWGEVIWADFLSPSKLDLDNPHRYHEYFGKYHNLAGHLFHRHRIGEDLTLTGNIQLRYLHKSIHQTPIGIYDPIIYDLDWLFLSPRVGINYAVNENLSPYFSFSIASHDPYDDMIDDADDPDDIPRLEVVDSSAAGVIYGDPLVDPERVYDFELGANYRSEKVAADANLFWMEYRNEIVPDGGLNNDGFPTVGNAERSVHRGVELSLTVRPLDNLTLEGNYAVNDNWIKEYDQNIDIGGGEVETTEHRDVMVPNFPKYLGNLVVDYGYGPARLVYRLRAVGRQFVSMDGRYAYIDGEMVDVSIAPHTVSSIKGSYKLGSLLGGADLILEGRIDNLFDVKYETYGYRWGDYFAYWPAAERNWFVNLKLTI